MGRKSKLLISLLTGTVLLYCGYYFGVPAVLNSPKGLELVKTSIKKETGFDAELLNAKFKAGGIPSILFSADEFKILNKDLSSALSVENINSNIKLLPLVAGKVEIENLKAKSFKANFILDKNFKLKLGDYYIPKIKDSGLKISKVALEIQNYNITLNDESVQNDILLTGKNFILSDFTNNKRIKFSTDSELFTGKKKSTLNADIDIKLPLTNITENKLSINGQIKDLNLSDFSTYTKFISNNKIQTLSGIINLDLTTSPDAYGNKKINGNLSLKNLGIIQKDISSSIYCPDELKVDTTISLLRNGINIEDLKAISKGIDTALSGTVTKLNTKSPKTDLRLSINPSKIEAFLPLLPGDENFQNSFNLYLLKKHKYFGDIIGNLNIKGNYLKPSIMGNILSTNGYLEKPIPNNTPKATVKLQFKGDTTYLDAFVPASKTETVSVKGDIKLYDDKSADLMITSSKNVDLKTAQNVLNPLHRILKFELGPVPIMDIKGKGNIKLHVVGNINDPHAWGVFNFTDTTASFLDIHNMTLSKGKGSLTFDDQNSHFKTSYAELYGRPVSIDGTCSLLGVLDFKVKTDNQNSENLLKIIKTSPMLKDIQKIASPIKSSKGLISIDLNLTGTVLDVYDVVFNKNIFAKGHVKLAGNEIKIEKLPLALNNVSGEVDFKNFDADFYISSKIGSSTIHTNGRIKDNIIQTTAYSDKFTLGDAIKLGIPQNKKFPFQKDLSTISTSFIANYKGSIEKINTNDLQVKGKIYSNNGSKSTILTDGGSFELSDSHLKISPIQGTFKKNPYILTADITNFQTPKQVVNGYFSMSKFNLENISSLKTLDIFPSTFNIEDIKDMKGVLDLTARIRRNNLSFFTKLNGTEFVYSPQNTKIKFNSGNILIRNNLLTLGKINAKLGEMPILIDGNINNFLKNPDMNLYINTKPTQEFFDQIFNNNALYPIKIKGDILATSKISGTPDKIAAKTEIKIEENSYLYYMGATIGDATNQVKLYLDNIQTPKWAKVNSFKYDKIIPSQNNKNFVKTQLTSSGIIEFLPNNNISFKNFKVKTENPTDAKIFNIIFRKPFMKQGIFTSDLTINGNSLTPKIIGTLDISSIDIPFINSTINDVNLNFNPSKILIKSGGTVLSNRLDLSAVMKNEIKSPYIIEELNLKMKDLNINTFTDAIRDFESDLYRSKTPSAEDIAIPQIIVKNGNINADTVQIKNINAEEFSSNFNLNEKKQLDIKNFRFKLAEGIVNGSMKYNFQSKNANLLVHMKDSNAQIMAETLFNLNNQIFGSVTGDIELNCNAQTQESCTKTLDGNGYFIVKDGRMPKLGSLEYLLKAGNLLQGGITGLSINGIIDLITPLKTGDFDSISGNMNFTDGVAQRINIYSNGKDLNMYLNGSYDFSTSQAQMNVYGALSNNITNVFGKVKNASLNTLLNTIPLINKNELNPEIMSEINKIPNMDSKNIYRIFNAEINGDINGNDYVRTFRWIK